MSGISPRARHRCVCGATAPLAPPLREVLHNHSATVEYEYAAALFHSEHEACRWEIAS